MMEETTWPPGAAAGGGGRWQRASGSPRRAGGLMARPLLPVTAANELACRGLDHLEEKIPALQYPPEKVSLSHGSDGPHSLSSLPRGEGVGRWRQDRGSVVSVASALLV